MFRSLVLASLLALALPGAVLAGEPTPAPSAGPVEHMPDAPCPGVEYENGVPVIPDDAPSGCMYIQGGEMLGGELPTPTDPCAPLADGSTPEMCQSSPLLISTPVEGTSGESCVVALNGEQVCTVLVDDQHTLIGGEIRSHGSAHALMEPRVSDLTMALLVVLTGLVGYLFGARSRERGDRSNKQ